MVPSATRPRWKANMSSPRSLFSFNSHRDNSSPVEERRSNGWVWRGRSMNDSSPDGSLFSFRSVFSPLSSSTNMQESDEQTKSPPQPAHSIRDRLAPTYEAADKIFRRFHHHSISDSSAVGSNDSSPTTTISTVDDSSATEPSPGSSPESPPPASFAGGMHRPRTADDARPFFELQKQPPPKKGRNLKNLAVNTSRNPGRGLSTASLPLPNTSNNDVPSDSSSTFVKPPTPSKRKPSNLGLTLLTPGTGKPPLQEIRLAIPPTPGLNRPGALRHFQSSPQLPSFPELSLRDNSNVQSSYVGTTLETIFSPVEQSQEQSQEQEEPNYDVPLSQEEKPEAYPDGPICVYENIDLYLEPTVEQAREYDVIMNVASEVRNPFDEPDMVMAVEPEIRIDGGGGIQFAPKRDRVPLTLATANSKHDASPTTPKATPLSEKFDTDEITPRARKDPEYIHIKWEHNSDIVPDLLRLVKLIDDKVMLGQRMLVHCQCGVSRSASLVVAYGLYKNPALSVQEAYDAVKQRSKWIGPNMNLIMQLQEFRTSLMHGGLLPANRLMTPITPSSAFTEWRGPFAANLTGPYASQTPGVPPVIKSQTVDTIPDEVSGPSSAPTTAGFTRLSSDQATSQRARAVSAVKPGTAYVNTIGQAIPAVPTLKLFPADTNVPSPPRVDAPSLKLSQLKPSTLTSTERATSAPTEEDLAFTPIQPSPDVDAADSFGLMSPTSMEFSSSPFDRAALLARLGMNPVDQQEDPAPRRSASLRTKRSAPAVDGQDESGKLKQGPKLRIKVSSPDLREQQQLQSLQERIHASHLSDHSPVIGDGEALMSPRATEFTQNPFALSASIPASPATPTSADSDPRSPVQQKGVSPITRNILDVVL